MDLLEIRTLASELMEDEGFNTNSVSFYNSRINEAQKRLAEIVRIHFKKSTSSSLNGVQKYAIPSDFMVFQDHRKSLRYENSTSNILLPSPQIYEYLDNLYDDLHTLTGDPKYFWLEDKYIGFYPIPDFDGVDNIELTYYNYPTVLSLNTDVCDFSDRYLYPLAFITCQLIYERNERPQEAAIYEGKAKIRLAEINVAIDDLVTINSQRTRRVRFTG